MRNRSNFIPSTKNVNLNVLELPSCVSLSEYGRCGRLNILNCVGASCHFKQTNQDEKSSEDHCRQKLLSLSKPEQLRIAKKYYGGSMPWKE